MSEGTTKPSNMGVEDINPQQLQQKMVNTGFGDFEVEGVIAEFSEERLTESGANSSSSSNSSAPKKVGDHTKVSNHIQIFSKDFILAIINGVKAKLKEGKKKEKDTKNSRNESIKNKDNEQEK